MRRALAWGVGTVCLTSVLLASLTADELAKKAEAVKPPWQRLLQGEDARKAAEQEEQLAKLQAAGRFEEARKVAQALAELRVTAQGADHWEAINARFAVDAIRCAQKAKKEEQHSYSRSFAIQRQIEALLAKERYRDAQPLLEQVLAIRRAVLGEEHPETAVCCNNLASNLDSLNKYTEAEAYYRKALSIQRKALGEEHPETATSYNNLSSNLDDQGRHADAEAGYRKALAIRRNVLGEDHVDTATSYNNLGFNLQEQGKYPQAEAEHHKALAIRRKLLGEKNLETATSYNNLATVQGHQAHYAEAEKSARKALDIHLQLLGENHPDTARCYNTIAFNLEGLGKLTQAEVYYRKALTIRRKTLGENDLDTASSYNNFATNQIRQGKFVEADQNLHTALSIRLAVLGEDHPDTALSYNNLAFNLGSLGRYQDAEKNYRIALKIYRRLSGEEHPDTARVYNNIALNLNHQGRYGEADEIARKALALRRRVLGEAHPETAVSYNNVAGNLADQGNYAEAEKRFRKALDAFIALLGDHNSTTATGYNNVAGALNAQGKHREAEEYIRKALAIYQETFRGPHPRTAAAYRNLAAIFEAEGRHRDAEEHYRTSLAICREALGEKHPLTALTLHNIGNSLTAQGRYQEAEEVFDKALAIRRHVLGEDHPHTADSYNGKALTLYARGKYQEAESTWGRAAESFAIARLHLATSGLGRAAKTSERSPLLSLAAILARNGKPGEAWQRFEESLARGTWDDLTARLRRPPAARDKQAQISARIDRLNELLDKARDDKPTPEENDQREKWLTQLRQVYDELAAFTQQLENNYGPIAGQVFTCAQIQKSLAHDAALLAWLDLPGQAQAKDPHGEHWAILLRPTGDPVWARLQGSGDQDAWIDADTRLPQELRTALQTAGSNWQPLVRRLRKQRLQPLSEHLMGVRRLIVLPSTALAGVPVEVFADGYTVSYAHSGTMFAHLLDRPAATGKGLFALADPIFDPPNVMEKPLPLPPAGVLLTRVLPGSNAAKAGLKRNDVLLRYGDTDLTGPQNFEPRPESPHEDKSVPVIVWRDGQTRKRPFFVRPGKLGVVIAKEPAPQALAEQHRLDRLLASRSGDDGQWKRLPGTRIEAAALHRLFDNDAPVKILVDSESSEQRLNELASSGELSTYRYLHLATHGEVHDTFPLRSAVILARDNLPDDKQRTQLLLAGQPIPDGRLEVEEVLRRWNLHCDLVTLSACQTALGKHERGEGFVGFAQALVLCGSRSVCLSLWKVDDTATALLMERFYQNLLGKREGLKAPLSKAAALAEAKVWLRKLPLEEAVQRAASISEAAARGKVPGSSPPRGALSLAKTKEPRPFAHPYYWAAFVLVGHAD